MVNSTLFIAYPSSPSIIGEQIENAVKVFSQCHSAPNVTTWKELDIAGKFIASAVKNRIASADAFVADITHPNFNVTYEIGYAIGRGMKCLLLVNSAIDTDRTIFNSVGIFDTLGYKNYQNTEDLLRLFQCFQEQNNSPVSKEKRRDAPVYVLQSQYKTDWSTRITSRLKKARINYRSFDAEEQPRLSAFEAIQEVAISYGVIIPLIDSQIKGSQINNLRGAFLAGLADAMNVHKILLQQGEDPVPIDLRDFCSVAAHPKALDRIIHDFARDVTACLRDAAPVKLPKPETFLQRLDLGNSSAENEIKHLGDYYLAVEPFRSAMRGDARLVVGRKGAGKSAIFFRLRDEKRRCIRNIVLDLKPDGYKLKKFKDIVLKLLKEGSAEHLVTAFWEYLLLLEVANKVLECDSELHTRDSNLYEPYRKLAEAFRSSEYPKEGDFSERMSAVIDSISDQYQQRFGSMGEVSLSSPDITEIVYRRDIRQLLSLIEDCLRHKDELWILFDNIDKGWATSGVESEDLLIIRALLEATRKLERQLQKHDVAAHTVVFLRNDVYELLVSATPDRGKESKVSTDWFDKDLLRELVRLRIVHNGLERNAKFDDVWSQICVSHVDGENSAEYLIDRSLMRPRFLLDLIGYCKGHAVSLNHKFIEESDIRKGMELFSNDLVTAVGYEIRDVFPKVDDVLYAFISSQSRLKDDEAKSLLESFGVVTELHDQVIRHLIWFGFFGVQMPTGEITYMHSVHYNVSRMKGILQKLRADHLVYQINPAFWPALGNG